MALTPQGSRDYQFEYADAYCHQDDQECDSKKANWKTDKAVLNQSERAKHLNHTEEAQEQSRHSHLFCHFFDRQDQLCYAGE